MKLIRIFAKIRSYSLKFACLTLALAIITLVATPPLHAQSLSLGLYPPLLEVMIKPGKSITQVFNILNFGDPVVLTTHVVPFTPRDELGNVHLQPEDAPPSPHIGWFSLANADLALGQSFPLTSDQNQQVVLKIKIPKTAPEGDYYLSLVFASKPQGDKLLGTQSKAKIAANILLTVSKTGLPQKSAKIVELKVPKIVDSFDKIPVTLKVKNTGTAFFKPLGQITLKGPFNLKSDFPLLPENVLANSTRILRASESAILDTKYKIPNTLTLSGFFLGPYKILAEITSLDGAPVSLGKEVSLLALPFKLTLALILMIGFLFLIKTRIKEESP